MTIGQQRQQELAVRDRRIVEAYRSGKLQAEIATDEGISSSLVSLILKKNGARLSPVDATQRWHQATLDPASRAKAASANSRPIEERFFDKVTFGQTENDCWGWTGALDGVGYPQILHDKRRRKASHISLMIAGLPRPDNLYALHSCDNPMCTNPKHLRWGTQRENIGDALERGRMDMHGLALGVAARLGRSGHE